MPSLVKIRSVGAELFHVDRQTEMTNPIVGFWNFAKARKNTEDYWFQACAVFWMLYASFWVIPRRLNLTPGNFPEENIQQKASRNCDCC